MSLFVTAPSPKPLKFQRRKQTQVCLKYNGLGDAMSSFFLKNNLTNYYMLNWSKVMGRKIYIKEQSVFHALELLEIFKNARYIKKNDKNVRLST